MIKLGINYCDCSGVMSVCKAVNNLVHQTLCDFHPIDGKLECLHLRNDLDGHCDSPDAQLDARGKFGKPQIILTEEDIFDIRNKNTYPTYKGGDLDA